jgi:predicted RNase H-like nuclease
VANHTVAGIDGTKGGWVAIALENGVFVHDLLIDEIESYFDMFASVDVLAIDVPIGFGPRGADSAARSYLKGSASTVFTTLPEDTLERPFGPGLGVSAQTHALGRRIVHVTRLAQSDARIHEIHPEVSFRIMNNGQPLRYRKKTTGGMFERIELLKKQGIEVGTLTETAKAPLDDVLDAAAAAWSAHRIALGCAGSLPAPPELVDGRHICIWY